MNWGSLEGKNINIKLKTPNEEDGKFSRTDNAREWELGPSICCVLYMLDSGKFGSIEAGSHSSCSCQQTGQETYAALLEMKEVRNT